MYTSTPLYDRNMPTIAISTMVKSLLPHARTILEKQGCKIMPGGSDRVIIRTF